MSSDDSFDFWLAVEAVLVASTVFGMGMQAPYGELTRQAHGPQRAEKGGREVTQVSTEMTHWVLCNCRRALVGG